MEVVHKVQPLLPVFFSPALALLGSTPEFGINNQILDFEKISHRVVGLVGERRSLNREADGA